MKSTINTALLIGCTMLLASSNAFAVDKGKALTACKNEVTAKYGAVTKQRLKKFRSNGKLVVMRVHPKGGEATTVHCRFDGQQVVSVSTEQERAAVAQRS